MTLFEGLHVISGARSGAERFVLDYCLDHDLQLNGWCPRGKETDDGHLCSKYPLGESESEHMEECIYRNTTDAEALLVIGYGPIDGPAAFALEAAEHMGKPYFIQDLFRGLDTKLIHSWLSHHQLKKVYITGPSESDKPGIYSILKNAFQAKQQPIPGNE